MPNGGSAVFIRSTIIATGLYLLAITLKSRITPYATWEFDLATFRMLISETIPWFGAIFAGVYVALYSRFASQWSYLANLYNQIMQASVDNPPNGDLHEKVLRIWQAGFIEDAEDLHLAGKPMFATIIWSMLENPETESNFINHSPGGAERLAKLKIKVSRALKSSILQQGLKITNKTMPTSNYTDASIKGPIKGPE